MKLLFDCEAVLIQGYNLHSTDMSGAMPEWGLLDQCASPESCWLFAPTIVQEQWFYYRGCLNTPAFCQMQVKERNPRCLKTSEQTWVAKCFLFFVVSFTFQKSKVSWCVTMPCLTVVYSFTMSEDVDLLLILARSYIWLTATQRSPESANFSL